MRAKKLVLRSLWIWLLVLSTVFISTEGRGAEPVPTALTLVDAKQQAADRNWDLLSAQRDVAIAATQKETAHEFSNPTLAFSTSKINTDGKGNGTLAGGGFWDRSYDTVVALTQPIEIGGKRANSQASAGAGYKAARAQYADTHRLLEVSVSRSYIAAVLADTAWRLAVDSGGFLRKEAELAAVRLKAGDIAQADLDRIEIAARQMELQAQNARAAAVGQHLAFEILIGIAHPRGDVVLSDDLEILADNGPPASSEHAALRPDLASAEQILRKAEADLRLQRAMRIPDPALTLQYEHQPPDGPNTMGVGLSFPLPLWNRNRGAIHRALLVREQASLAVGKIQAQIDAELGAARATYYEALTRWHDYRDNLRPRADRVRLSVSVAYEKGGASLLDLLEAQRSRRRRAVGHRPGGR